MPKDKKIVAGTFGPGELPVMCILIQHPDTGAFHQMLLTHKEYDRVVQAVVECFPDSMLPMSSVPVDQVALAPKVPTPSQN